jgi:hypothetical protein
MSVSCPSVPILGDQLNPVHALVFSSTMIISVVMLPLNQGAVLVFIAVIIIAVSMVADYFGFMKHTELKSETSATTSHNMVSQSNQKDIPSEASTVTTTAPESLSTNSATDASTPVVTTTDQEVRHDDPAVADNNAKLQIELKKKTQKIAAERSVASSSTTTAAAPITPARRLQRSSSTCEFAYRGLGGWSPSLYLDRFGRFQMLELPSAKIVPPNAREINSFENEFFVGKILVMFKTAPVDEVKYDS